MGYYDTDSNSQWIIDWIHRMCEKYGGIVYDNDGPTLDWGQAICRGRYGLEWSGILSEKQIDRPDIEAILLAREWEKGLLPDWMNIDRMERERTQDIKKKVIGFIDETLAMIVPA